MDSSSYSDLLSLGLNLSHGDGQGGLEMAGGNEVILSTSMQWVLNTRLVPRMHPHISPALCVRKLKLRGIQGPPH